MESQEQSSLMSGIWATKNSQALELRIVNFVSMNFDYQSFVMIWFAPTAKAQLFENEKILICDFSRGVLNTCSEATNKDFFILRGASFLRQLKIYPANLLFTFLKYGDSKS